MALVADQRLWYDQLRGPARELALDTLLQQDDIIPNRIATGIWGQWQAEMQALGYHAADTNGQPGRYRVAGQINLLDWMLHTGNIDIAPHMAHLVGNDPDGRVVPRFVTVRYGGTPGSGGWLDGPYHYALTDDVIAWWYDERDRLLEAFRQWHQGVTDDLNRRFRTEWAEMRHTEEGRNAMHRWAMNSDRRFTVDGVPFP